MRIISGTARGTKLYTLEGLNTRPTLDRVKESIFNIIQNEISESIVLDLFAGSGAIGLEAASRGAKKVILCDNTKEAIQIINKNITKTHLQTKVEVYNCDFKTCLQKLEGTKIDLIYLDPPYDTDFIQKAIKTIIELELIDEDSLIIAETDDLVRILEKVKEFKLELIDNRKYGRAHIIFLKKCNIA